MINAGPRFGYGLVAWTLRPIGFRNLGDESPNYTRNHKTGSSKAICKGQFCRIVLIFFRVVSSLIEKKTFCKIHQILLQVLSVECIF